MSASIILTDNAAAKVWELIEEEDSDFKFRVYVTGGGCSGFQYGFAFEKDIAPDDMVIANGRVQLLVDPLSAQYLKNAEIDYQEDIEGERFIIRNPNAKTTCGCGSSFTVDDAKSDDATE